MENIKRFNKKSKKKNIYFENERNRAREEAEK